ncbi:hypothetical protein HDU76_007826 [Blyttiomyces sp. JEL0837]|nr:hypothetical protein HDU76_007826 [Blyttiomyces sp. JEL0837]
MGAFLRHTPRNRIGSFTENFSQIQRISGKSLSAVGAIEVIRNTTPFPLLLDSMAYHPDTTDLSDPKLQHYWIDLLDKNLSDLVSMVLEWQGKSENSKVRAASFEAMYRDHLQRLRKEPNAYGALSVRGLLNLREQCLREMGFTDVFEGVKKAENTSAISLFHKMLQESESMSLEDRIVHLTDNILAGNMYDWGSTSIQEILKKGELAFEQAKEKVRHPTKYDDLDALKARLTTRKYRKAVIFVDNSGADAILGIIPFARLLLSMGTVVILAANTRPSVNDITAYELEGVLAELANIDEVLKTALQSLKLKVVGTGSASPCLDLRRVSDELASESEDADFVVIEGMGRAIHTNFFAKFKVDCLKIAVFKNPQVADELGAEMYDGIRIFEPAN